MAPKTHPCISIVLIEQQNIPICTMLPIHCFKTCVYRSDEQLCCEAGIMSKYEAKAIIYFGSIYFSQSFSKQNVYLDSFNECFEYV